MTYLGPFIDGSKYPLYNATSNEGGGRAIEMERRANEQRALDVMKGDARRELETHKRSSAAAQAEYEHLKAQFVEKYGAPDPAAFPARELGSDDTLELSEEAKAYLSDLQSLEAQRRTVDRSAEELRSHEAARGQLIGARESIAQFAAAGWDMSFAPSGEERLAGWNRLREASHRLATLGAEAAGWQAERQVGWEAVKAGSAALTEGLSGPALFKVRDDGAIEFDVQGLGHLSPDAQAAAQLERLVEILSARNGFSPLQGAVKNALDIQNAYIAAHPVVVAAVKMPF